MLKKLEFVCKLITLLTDKEEKGSNSELLQYIKNK